MWTSINGQPDSILLQAISYLTTITWDRKPRATITEQSINLMLETNFADTCQTN